MSELNIRNGEIWRRLAPFIISFFVVFIAIWVIFINNYRSFEGNIWGSLLPGSKFGVSQISKDIGIYPVTEVGWDGQFYYSISNDLLGVTDAPKHIDSPSYRYQRIALPLLANLFSKLFGFYNYTPPLIYHFVQILLLFIASVMLCKYFIRNNINPFFSLLWSLSLNTTNSLLHGLTDVASDSLFIISFILLIERRYWLYIFTSTLLLTNREGYAVFAAIIFLCAFFGKLENVKKYSLSSLKFTIPGIILVFWYAYVTLHFGKTPASQAYGMTDWFAKSWIVNLNKSIASGNNQEIYFHIIGIIFLAFATYYIFTASQRKFIWYAVLAYTVLLWHLGMGVTDYYQNYLKALTIFVAILPILIPKNGRAFKYSFLILSILVIIPSSFYTIQSNVFKASTWVYTQSTPDSIDETPTTAFKDFKSEIYLVDTLPTFVKGNWLFGKDETILKIGMRNTSSEIWRTKPFGKNVVHLSYHWLDSKGQKVIADGVRTNLTKNIYPGELLVQKMVVKYPELPGSYILRISLVQEGVAWFYSVGGGHLDFPVNVIE